MVQDPFRALVHANRSLAFLRLDAYDRAVEDVFLCLFVFAGKMSPNVRKYRKSTGTSKNNAVTLRGTSKESQPYRRKSPAKRPYILYLSLSIYI